MIKTILNPEYRSLERFIKDLPSTFLQSGEVFHSARNLIKTFNTNSYRLNVKSFKKPLLINQIIYATFRSSKAKRSYNYARKLIEKGFHTPMPVAYIEECKNNLLTRSFYISIHEEFNGIMQELRFGSLEGRENLLRKFGWFTADLHESQILHIDYSSGNILYKKKEDKYVFYLVDLNRMTFGKQVSLEKGCYNFRRLWGSDEMLALIVSSYAKARNFDEEICLKKTFGYRKQFWDNFSRQHPGWSPYVAD